MREAENIYEKQGTISDIREAKRIYILRESAALRVERVRSVRAISVHVCAGYTRPSACPNPWVTKLYNYYSRSRELIIYDGVKGALSGGFRQRPPATHICTRNVRRGVIAATIVHIDPIAPHSYGVVLLLYERRQQARRSVQAVRAPCPAAG